LSSDVQFHSCQALCNLAADPDNRRTLMRLGLHQLIKQAMVNHPSSADVQHAACGVLSNLAESSANRITLMQLGVFDAIKQAIESGLEAFQLSYETLKEEGQRLTKFCAQLNMSFNNIFNQVETATTTMTQSA